MRVASMTFAILATVVTASTAQQTQPVRPNSERLDSYLGCEYSLGLSPVSIARRPAEVPPYRSVQTATGEKRISVTDGYTVMLSQGEPAYFANMKIEQSEPKKYASDKDAMIKSLEFIMDSSPAVKSTWSHTTHRGFDVYGLADLTMEGNGPNGIYVLFHDPTHVIVTIYFLGQPVEFRKFTTIERYEAMRDAMLDELTACANRPSPARAADSRPLRTAEDLNVFITQFYMRPRPDRISEALAAVATSGVMQIPEAVRPIAGFFSEVFLINPSRTAEWQPVIDKQRGPAKSTLDSALSWSRSGGVMALTWRTPEMNDIYWGAFFASGNPAYVRKLVELLPHAEERSDYALWSVGASAKWSLASNARQHPLVKSILEEMRSGTDKRTGDLIRDVLDRDPARIGRELAQVYEKQKAAGKWP